MSGSSIILRPGSRETNDMAEWLRELPLYWAKIISTVFFMAVTIWALMRPRAFIFSGAPNRKVWRDLRLWAVVILIVQIVLYIGF